MFLLIFSLFQNTYAKETLTLAVHPFLSPVEIEKRFTPLVNYLSFQSGFNIILKIGSNYEEHIEYIGTDKVDIAYMGPVSYVKLVNLYGLKPILAKLEVKGQSYFQGVFIVRKESNIKSLAELKDKRIALGNTNSTMSFIVPHYQLHQAGILKEKTISNQLLATHENIALAVLSGDFDVGAVKPAVYKNYQPYGLRLLEKTPKISEHLFVTSSKLPQKQIQMLREIMIDMKSSTDGLAALQGIKKDISALVPATDSDYTNLKEIISAEEYLHLH